MTTLTRLSSLLFSAMMTFSSLISYSSADISAADKSYLIGTDTITFPKNSDTVTKRYLALGDSYTIGQSVKVNERYPVQIVEKLRLAGFKMAEAEIIATSGWTTTDLLNAINEKADAPAYDMVTLLIGVNNQYQGGSIKDYRIEFINLLRKAIHFAGERPDRVIVLSIPDYSVTPFARTSDKEKIVREINVFNQVNKNISNFFHVHYVNVTEESRRAATDHSLIAYDDLHFSGKEYSVWTALTAPVFIQALKRGKQ